MDFGAWSSKGATVQSIDWAITTAPTGGNTLYSGLADISGSTTVNPNSYGYNVADDSFNLPSLSLSAGTYYLQLNNAVASNGGYVYWDLNGGPSLAYINGNGYNNNPISGESFQIHGSIAAPATPAPPLSACLAFTGVLVLQAFRRQRQSA